MRWKLRFFVSFFIALLCGGFVGGCLVFILQLAGLKTIILIFLCLLFALFVLWIIFFQYFSKIMHWLADENAAAQINDLPQNGYWGELVRRLTRILRQRDLQIRQKEEQLFNLFKALQAAPIGILLLDNDKRLIWGNDHAAGYLGLCFPKDYQQYITNLVRYPEFVSYLSSLDATQLAQPLALNLVLESRQSFLIQIMTDHEHAYNLLLIQDNTEQEKINQMRQDFVANISHEIRTPLTVLSGFIETMQHLPLSDNERKYYLDLMAQQSDRIHRLVNDLLRLAKLENSSLPKLDTWVSMDELFDQVKNIAQEISASKQVLEFSSPENQNTVQIAGDSSEILSAMTNIVSNAIRYTPQSGKIHIGWYLDQKNRCVFFVKDNGPGIAKEHLPRLAERFYRVDKGRSQQTGGTGLGLAIVKHVMQRHNGRLEIESSLGKGSMFTLYFSEIKA